MQKDVWNDFNYKYLFIKKSTCIYMFLRQVLKLFASTIILKCKENVFEYRKRDSVTYYLSLTWIIFFMLVNKCDNHN